MAADEQTALLREILKWIRFEAKPRLRELLAQTLKTPEEQLVYELSDGEKSTRDIAKLIPVSSMTVSRYWQRWLKLGIVEESGKYVGRCRRVCSLSEVGLEVPKLPAITEGAEMESKSSTDEEPSPQDPKTNQ